MHVFPCPDLSISSSDFNDTSQSSETTVLSQPVQSVSRHPISLSDSHTVGIVALKAIRPDSGLGLGRGFFEKEFCRHSSSQFFCLLSSSYRKALSEFRNLGARRFHIFSVGALQTFFPTSVCKTFLQARSDGKAKETSLTLFFPVFFAYVLGLGTV